MKFFYNGKLIRTSKTHKYTHAVMLGDRLISCASSYDLAVKSYNSYVGTYKRNQVNYRRAMSALSNGKDYYVNVDGKKVSKDCMYSYEEYTKFLNHSDYVVENTKIVELEERA